MTSTANVADHVRDAAARGAGLRVCGRGTWLTANRPVRATETLSLADLSGIVEYVPGDLTITVRAGTSLGEIADATRAHRQWLALDPHGGPNGSIGATVATASAGPLAATFGTPRDHALGVEFVTGAGDIVRGGGRVVKNVAGFDLVRLTTGAWGTLGAITELSLRLRALPPADETLACSIDDGAAAIERVHAGLTALPSAPLAAELLDAALAGALGLAAAPTLLVRIGGNGALMRAQRHALSAMGTGALQPVDGDVWSRLGGLHAVDAAVWRMSSYASSIATTWAAARTALAAAGGGWMHGSVLRGVVRCVAPTAMTAQNGADCVARALASPFDGVRVGETLPARAWASLPSTNMDRLSRGIRAAFDPSHILNPGILGEAS